MTVVEELDALTAWMAARYPAHPSAPRYFRSNAPPEAGMAPTEGWTPMGPVYRPVGLAFDVVELSAPVGWAVGVLGADANGVRYVAEFAPLRLATVVVALRLALPDEDVPGALALVAGTERAVQDVLDTVAALGALGAADAVRRLVGDLRTLTDHP